jgi:hypothetical protein
VRFSDASRVEIQGVGSIVFQAKTGEYRVLNGVYFIPALRNYILSLGQLDEGGPRWRSIRAFFASGIAAGASL